MLQGYVGVALLFLWIFYIVLITVPKLNTGGK